MLVRALKMLDYRGTAAIGMRVATAALISRATKAALMTEAGRIGNAQTRAEAGIGRTVRYPDRNGCL